MTPGSSNPDPPSTGDVPEGMTPSCALIVGNGASLLGSGLGERIDSFETVVRFNLFKTGRFSDDVGRKATFWFCNRDARSPAVLSMLKRYSFEGIFVHTWRETGAAVESFRRALDPLGITTPVYEVEKHTLVGMRNFLNLKYSMFSTGAIGVWLMLARYREVSLVGFDWWLSPEKLHYCDSQTFVHHPTRGHQPKLERIFFEKLERTGRLRFLARSDK